MTPVQPHQTKDDIMKTLIKACVASALFLVPVSSFAQGASAEKTAPGMTCPAKMEMMGMQKSMGSMMGEVNAMKNNMRDPQMKDRMQKMHMQMSAMMSNMEKMGGGMMNGGMMGRQMAPAGKMKDAAPSATPPTTSSDHQGHHPAQ
jgi:hypothetical protein